VSQVLDFGSLPKSGENSSEVASSEAYVLFYHSLALVDTMHIDT
jgi:hypothetical protein